MKKSRSYDRVSIDENEFKTIFSGLLSGLKPKQIVGPHKTLLNKCYKIKEDFPLFFWKKED